MTTDASAMGSSPGTARRASVAVARQNLLQPLMDGDSKKANITTFVKASDLGNSWRKSVHDSQMPGSGATQPSATSAAAKRASTVAGAGAEAPSGDPNAVDKRATALLEAGRALGASPRRGEDKQALFRTMLQEEYVPPPGSIYSRSISPGPGYYAMLSTLNTKSGRRFGGKTKGNIDAVCDAVRDLPGPGQYPDPKGFAAEIHQLGRFDKAEKMVEASKRPFISPRHAEAEGFGTCGPDAFHSVTANSVAATKGYQNYPKFSFGRLRRPFG